MSLEMKDRCERCGDGLTADGAAFICSYECTFCGGCAAEITESVPTAAASSWRGRGGNAVILHDYLPSGNGYKVRLLLTQLGIPYRRIEYDVTRGETRTPEFLAEINPNGRVPVLETGDGEPLTESDAILFYLAEGTPVLPSGRLDRARVLQWMFFEQYSHSSQNARA